MTAPESRVPTDQIRDAARGLLDRMSWTYKARNGRTMSIEADDGEKCYIVHSDDIEELRRALATFDQAVPSGVDGLVECERHKQARWLAGNMVNAGMTRPTQQKWDGLYHLASEFVRLTQLQRCPDHIAALSPVPASGAYQVMRDALEKIRRGDFNCSQHQRFMAAQAVAEDALEALAKSPPQETVLDDIAEMMGEFVDNWPQPKKVSTALKLIAKTMRAALDPEPVTCPRAARLGSPLRYCDDCPEGDLCELPRQALTQQQTSKGEGA